MRRLLWLLLTALATAGEPDDETKELLRRAVTVKPSPRQLAWQRLEFTCFVHFGINTFTDREWGTGKEDPALFAPTAFDATQWARTCVAAGMRMIVLTAKHHDGFCLWPSRFTEHSVKNSPWRDGKGDVVREVADACRAHGLKLGLYLSPADLHEIGRSYGNGSPRRKATIAGQSYDVTDYDKYFMNQLAELLTQYGEITEVWFDGANPKPGTGQTYHRKAWYTLIRRLQPNAVIAIKGPDVRWVGNEGGHTRAAEWSVVPIPKPPSEFGWGDLRGKDLGSRAKIRDARHLVWYPAETDVSIRPGWFYHPSQDGRVRSLKNLLDIWYGAVGGNAVLLLNVPPDRRGLFHANDVARLKELGSTLRATFEENLAAGATGPAEILDGNPDTCWKTNDWTSTATIALELAGKKTFNRALLQEPIRDFGQRIERFALDAHVEGAWREIAAATVVGYKRILRFDAVTANRVRLRILASRVCPALSNFALYRAP